MKYLFLTAFLVVLKFCIISYFIKDNLLINNWTAKVIHCNNNNCYFKDKFLNFVIARYKGLKSGDYLSCDFARLNLIKNNYFFRPKYKAKLDFCVVQGSANAISTYRERLKIFIEQNIYSDNRNIIKSLVLGPGYLNDKQMNILQNNGISHLIAISGLHVGLLFGWLRLLFSFGLARFIYKWSYSGFILDCFVWCIVAGYVYLANSPASSIRALVMSLVMVLLHWYGFVGAKFLSLIIATLLIGLYDPFIITDPGFMMSCLGVFLLLSSQNITNFITSYIFLFLGFSVVSLLFFDGFSISSLITNILVVPVFNLWVIPLSLIGLLLFLLSGSVSLLIWQLATKGCDIVWPILNQVADYGYLTVYNADFYKLVLALFAVLLVIILPRFYFGYWGLCCLLPLFCCYDKMPVEQGFNITVLDVGQGLSVLIRTKHYNLLYDTGGRYKNWNAGKNIIVPYLYKSGIKKLDKLIISHGDLDHSGGAKYVYDTYLPKVVLSGEPKRLSIPAVNCFAGQSWVWDNIKFEILSPDLWDLKKGNNASCVLLISDHLQSVLLPGDIDKTVEALLVEKYKLKLTGLIVPHHGSITSSSLLFLDSFKPNWAIISSGVNNRFNLPNQEIIFRYFTKKIKVFDTQHFGFIKINSLGKINAKV